MDRLRLLLSELRRYTDKDKQIRKEKFSRGECFNIFNVLGLSSNETRTHSAFLAELLNPNGSHGCGSAFLAAFAKRFIDKPIPANEIQNAAVEIERTIGFKNDDATEGGRFDIVLTIGKFMVIIENKIYAQDQEKQLLRYKNYALSCISKRQITDYKLLYLTLDGKEASSFSTASELMQGNDYFSISYNSDILDWLRECKEKSVDRPLIRETISQYINLIKELTNQDMDTKQQEQMFAVMAEYPEAVATMFHSGFTAFRNYVFHNFCSPFFKVEAEKRGLIYDESNMLSGEKYVGFHFFKPQWQDLCIYVGTDNYDKNFFVGIVHKAKSVLATPFMKLDCFDQKPTNEYVYGWSYLKKYNNWYSDIIVSMKDGSYCNHIMDVVDLVLNEAIHRHIFDIKD